jgi:hypothetical protein
VEKKIEALRAFSGIRLTADALNGVRPSTAAQHFSLTDGRPSAEKGQGICQTERKFQL